MVRDGINDRYVYAYFGSLNVSQIVTSTCVSPPVFRDPFRRTLYTFGNLLRGVYKRLAYLLGDWCTI